MIGQYAASMHTSNFRMEPLLPQDAMGILRELAVDILQKSSRLSGVPHPVTGPALIKLVRAMNCYYSSLMEGHHTLPLDIERALASDYDGDPQTRDLQLESIAHIQTRELMETRLSGDPDAEIFGSDFLCWIHKEFFCRLPGSMHIATDKKGATEKIMPGQMRKKDVIVGKHIGPSSSSLDQIDFMSGPLRLDTIQQRIMAYAHYTEVPEIN